MKIGKKILVFLSVFCFWYITTFWFALDEKLENKLSLEPSRWVIFEFMADYLLPDIPKSYTYIQLYYTDIKKTQKSYEHLQKIVYTGALPNKKLPVNTKAKMNAYQFFNLIVYITGYDFISDQNEGILKKRNVKVSDLVMVKDVISSGNFEDDEDKLEYYLEVLHTEEEKNKMKIFFDVYYTMISDYYHNENIDVNKLLYSSIEWLVEGAQDQFSVYFPPIEAKNFEEGLSGEFEWIGSYIEMEKPWILRIISPISGTPSERAGLRWWDVITHVDGWEIQKSTTINEAVGKIKGPAGTKVVLTILRDGEILTIEVTRAKIIITDVEYKTLENGFFYIQIKNFWEKVYGEFTQALEELKKSNQKKIIIDLRNNPGGYLDQVTEMLSLFVKKWEKTAVIKHKDYDYNYYSKGYQVLDLNEYKIYILINSGTASASEIMAWTLKDYFPHIDLIWEKTYGKGSVQTMRSYYDGSTLKYTIAVWVTGKTQTQIDTVWILPDVEIELDIEGFKNGKDNQLDFILKNY